MFAGRLVLFPLVEWAVYRYLRKPYRELQESVAKGWGLFAGMTALYYLLLAVTANFPVLVTKRPQELPAFLLVMALMPMTYATILTAMYRQILLFQRQQSERMLRERKNVLEMRLENQQCIRKMKHDMKSYTATLSGLLAAGETKKAEDYLRGMEQETDSGWGQFSRNPYINATAAYYDRKLEEPLIHIWLKALKAEVQAFKSGEKYRQIKLLHRKDIHAYERKVQKLQAELSCTHSKAIDIRDQWFQIFEDMQKEYGRKLEELHAKRRIDIRIGEEALPHMEICRILANGMENACDELGALAKEDREMSVHMQYNREHLLIRIRNRCRKGRYVEQGKLPETDKEGQGHGYGLRSMQEDVERLLGDMACYTDNGYFVLDVMIPCRCFVTT